MAHMTLSGLGIIPSLPLPFFSDRPVQYDGRMASNEHTRAHTHSCTHSASESLLLGLAWVILRPLNKIVYQGRVSYSI